MKDGIEMVDYEKVAGVNLTVKRSRSVKRAVKAAPNNLRSRLVIR